MELIMFDLESVGGKKMHFDSVNVEQLQELDSQLMNNGTPVVQEAEFFSRYDNEILRMFMNLVGVYVWPTVELIEFLKVEIGNANAIEIGSGNGVIAKELGIKATDNYLQSTRYIPPNDNMRVAHRQMLSAYDRTGAALPPYGENVLQYEAIDAVRKFKPEVVLGCYVTHKWKPGLQNGNMFGIDENAILQRSHVNKYIVVGNRVVHKDKPILGLKHREIELPGLVVRAAQPAENRVFIWRK